MTQAIQEASNLVEKKSSKFSQLACQNDLSHFHRQTVNKHTAFFCSAKSGPPTGLESFLQANSDDY